MDTILTLVAAAGFIGSVAIMGWGMVLCLTQGLGAGEPLRTDVRHLNTSLPAGTRS